MNDQRLAVHWKLYVIWSFKNVFQRLEGLIKVKIKSIIIQSTTFDQHHEDTSLYNLWIFLKRRLNSNCKIDNWVCNFWVF